MQVRQTGHEVLAGTVNDGERIGHVNVFPVPDTKHGAAGNEHRLIGNGRDVADHGQDADADERDVPKGGRSGRLRGRLSAGGQQCAEPEGDARGAVASTAVSQS